MHKGIVYNIQRMSIQDGPGIRTTVFMKGCPLRCLWCSNPESQLVTPQVLYFETLCVGCGACQQICPHNAISLSKNNMFERDVQLCRHCGACVGVCPSNARELSGKAMTVEDIMEVVRKDISFYDNSGGGLTIGGGEPTAAGEFFLELLQAAYDEALHVAVDTCGMCPEERFDKTLKLAHMVLFDCKHMDGVQHKRLTGVDNTLILRNLRAALESRAEVRIRMPLMPNLNDSDENFAAMAAFFKPYGHSTIDVMPCHMFGRNKYLALGQKVPDISQYSPDALQDTLSRMQQHGLNCVII